MRRRDFIKGSALSGGILLVGGRSPQAQGAVSFGAPEDSMATAAKPLPDLSPDTRAKDYCRLSNH